jgi:hypothetical protein
MKLISADGHEIHEGDTVFIKKFADAEEYEEKIVAEIVSDIKLLYDKPCSEGYIGARQNIVFKEPPDTNN